jgi:hypothetical protein
VQRGEVGLLLDQRLLRESAAGRLLEGVERLRLPSRPRLQAREVEERGRAERARVLARGDERRPRDLQPAEAQVRRAQAHLEERVVGLVAVERLVQAGGARPVLGLVGAVGFGRGVRRLGVERSGDDDGGHDQDDAHDWTLRLGS